ncbi:MerR family transcriptional regulator [Streptomyces purpurascens]
MAVSLPTVGRQRDGDSAPESFEGPPTAARVGREELLAAAGVDEEELRQWESYGLVTPLEDGAYEAEAVTVAALVAELGRFGIQPRHLRVMKAAADREAGLVDRGWRPRSSGTGTRRPGLMRRPAPRSWRGSR